MKEYIDKIIEIGQRGSCTSQDLTYFKGNLPDVGNWRLRNCLSQDYKILIYHLTRYELVSILPSIKKQSLSGDQKKLLSFLMSFIKGCHLIEIKYGGFGSVTNICNLFGTLIKIDVNKAIYIYNWIAFNGGNWYLDQGISFEKANKLAVLYSESENIKRVRLAKIHTDSVNRRQQNKDLHIKKSNEGRISYEKCKKTLQRMDDIQLISRFNEDVGKPGWVAARGRFHEAIKNEFHSRGFDYSAIGNKNWFSFKKKITLSNQKIILIS